MVVDIGPSADWVKINVQRTVCLSCTYLSSIICWIFIILLMVLTSFSNPTAQKDCYEVYALVPGLLREEVSRKSHKPLLTFFTFVHNVELS